MNRIYQVHESLLSAAECGEIIENCNAENWVKDTYVDTPSRKLPSYFRGKKIGSYSTALPAEKMPDSCMERITEILKPYQIYEKHFRVNRYLPGHYQAWHSDFIDIESVRWHPDFKDLDIENINRVKSLVIQLSSPKDYAGGELEFNRFTHTITTEQGLGMGILFNASLVHQVRRMTSGTRYSIVIWGWG